MSVWETRLIKFKWDNHRGELGNSPKYDAMWMKWLVKWWQRQILIDQLAIRSFTVRITHQVWQPYHIIKSGGAIVWSNSGISFGERNARIKAQSNAMTIPINFKPQLIFFGMKNVFASPESAFATFHATIDPNQGGGVVVKSEKVV